MRRWGVVVWVAQVALAAGAIPGVDRRQTEVPDFRTHARLPVYRSLEQWQTRRAQLRDQILSAAGLLPLPARPQLRSQSVRRLEFPGYTIETVLLETLPNYFLGANLYRPAGRPGPFPAVLTPHGHWKHGRLEDLPSYSVPALAINLARQGYVVLAYDMVGYNDTRQTTHSFGSAVETLWSFRPMGLQLWNSIRALDYLESLGEVDAHRIAATGASGGATQTFLLAAVDDRIGYAAPVNMISAYMQGGDPCEEAPTLRLGTSNVEIAAMIAPRPMLIVSSTRDWTRHTPTEEFPALRRIYTLYGQAGRVRNAHIDAEHNYNRQSREAVYRFLAAHLQPDLAGQGLEDRECEVPPDEDLLAFPKAEMPRDLADVDVFAAWKRLIASPDPADTASARATLGLALGVTWPGRVDTATRRRRLYLSRSGKGDRITGYWQPGEGAPILVVNPAGADAAVRTRAVQRILRSSRPVLVLDPFVSHSVRARKQMGDRYFLSYNLSDDADRVQDILTALAFLAARYGERTELIGLDDAGIWCVFAAAVAPIAVDLIADLNGFHGTDKDFRERFFVPGIQRAGGLESALHLVGRLPNAVTAERKADQSLYPGE